MEVLTKAQSVPSREPYEFSPYPSILSYYYPV